MEEGQEKTKIGLVTAICIIVANMIGVGVFTSLGYQVSGTPSVLAIMLLWIAGGIVALCGALTYGELAVSFPRSGGEYNYLSKLYHPALGFLSGWVSATVGFAAPMAMMAMLFGDYFSNLFPQLSPVGLAISLVIFIALINISSFKVGSSFHTFFTILNILLILSISLAGYFLADHSHFAFTINRTDFMSVANKNFAVSLVYVSYAYSGWNSATYVAGEIRNPGSNLPKALFIGTMLVMFLYVLLNFIFLYSVPMPELAGQKEVAFVAAIKIFGERGGQIISIVISIALIASVNSMMITGPRVTQTIGEDFPVFKILSYKNKTETPIPGTLIQAAIAILLIYFSEFENVMTYIGFTLSLFIMLTVIGIFIKRFSFPENIGQYHTWGYPVTPILFLLLEGYMVFHLLKERPKESLLGLATVMIGLIIFFLINKPPKKSENI